jgi:hypothetical protein
VVSSLAYPNLHGNKRLGCCCCSHQLLISICTDVAEEEIIAGPPLSPQCNVELHTDYGGAAVRWGLTHHKESAADCCQACLDQAKNAKPGEIKCNIWVYCPSEFGCYSPDKYKHKHQECWLKQVNPPYFLSVVFQPLIIFHLSLDET